MKTIIELEKEIKYQREKVIKRGTGFGGNYLNELKEKLQTLNDVLTLVDKYSEYVYDEIEGSKHINSVDLMELKKKIIGDESKIILNEQESRNVD